MRKSLSSVPAIGRFVVVVPFVASFLGPINLEWGIYLCGIIGIGVVWLVVQQHAWVGYVRATADGVGPTSIQACILP